MCDHKHEKLQIAAEDYSYKSECPDAMIAVLTSELINDLNTLEQKAFVAGAQWEKCNPATSRGYISVKVGRITELENEISSLRGSLEQREAMIYGLEAKIKDLLDTLAAVEETSAWCYETLKHQLKFGLDEAQAVYRREMRSRGGHKEVFKLAHDQLVKFGKKEEEK